MRMIRDVATIVVGGVLLLLAAGLLYQWLGPEFGDNLEPTPVESGSDIPRPPVKVVTK